MSDYSEEDLDNYEGAEEDVPDDEYTIQEEQPDVKNVHENKAEEKLPSVQINQVTFIYKLLKKIF